MNEEIISGGFASEVPISTAGTPCFVGDCEGINL